MTRDLANRKATSQAGVAIQNAVVAKAKVQIETAKKNIETMTLRAPRDGYVNVQSNTNGNNFYQGMVLPMLQVGDKVRAGMARGADSGYAELGGDGSHRGGGPRASGAAISRC